MSLKLRADEQRAGHKILTCCHDTGPFLAHVVDGRWVKSTPIEPNLPVGHNAYAVRNRVNAPDRIHHPLKRVDFDPQGERNAQNRGRSRFARISWDEALDLVAGELDRVKRRYGASAILQSPIGHQWIGSLHNGRDWSDRFFAMLGGCSRMTGNTSHTGWRPGGLVIWGYGAVATNNAADILQNSKLIIHWASDVATKRYGGYRQNYWLQRFKRAGIRQVVIDPYFNDTAALYGDEWIPIRPETDEALMSAVAHIWISENRVNRSFISGNTVGFEAFRDYVLGVADNTPKTPRWAAPICGVSEQKITDLAREWASQPTYILCDYGGANRRHAAAEWSRMIVTMQALLGNIGRPGRGLGSLKFNTQGEGQRGIANLLPPLSGPAGQIIRHGHFSEAIMNPPVTWTTVDASGQVVEKRYPMDGCSKIKMIALMSGSGWFLNQIPGTPDHVQGMQSPEIEFSYCHAAWWHAAPKFSDVILPIRHVGERDDIVNWENFTVYSHTLVEPEGEPRNDLEILTGLAKRLGFGGDFTMGKSSEQWLRQIHEKLELPLSFEELKSKGYYKHPLPDEAPLIGKTFVNFYKDPAANKLNTPSGKIEIRSRRVVEFFGENHPQAPAVPKFIPSPEREAGKSSRYPLMLTSPHAKMGRHSQWRNLSWHRDEYQMSLNGRSLLMIGTADAAARNIHTGQLVRVFNSRGAIECSAFVTERLMPGVVRVHEGGWYTPRTPGDGRSVDIGGNPNVLISPRQPEPLCDGMIGTARVEVERGEA